MKKIGENQNQIKKGVGKKLIGVGILLIVIAIVATTVLLQQNRQIQNISPELARAMTYEQFLDGDEEVEGTNGSVKFRAFFLRDINNDGEADRIKGTARPIGEEDTLYMEIIVQTAGYLKDAKIQINGQNFYLQTALPEDNELLASYVGNNIKEIQFKELGTGTQKLLTGMVRSGDYTYSSSIANAIGKNINQYSREDNSIILTGTYVNGTEETPITKQIDLTVDWYGETEATINTRSYEKTQNNYDIDDRIDETNGRLNLDFYVVTNEVAEELIISKNYVKGTIPELNGYAPVEVTYTGTNATFQYNQETREFTLERIAQVNENGEVTQSVARTNYYQNIRISYPIEAYQTLGEDTVTISIPVETYYEGYNNPNTEFTNPYQSNTARETIVANFSNPRGTAVNFDIKVGKQIWRNSSYIYIISKQKPLRIYNGLSSSETDDTYQVRWYAYTGTNGASTGLVMKETKDGETQVSDRFIAGSTSESMEPVVSNIGIAFSGADNLLQEDGWINVYDDQTDELLVTFTKDNWNRYTSSNPYKYELPVKHVRVETSSTNAESSMYIYHIKEIDDDTLTTNYEKSEFDTFEYISSTLEAYMGGNHVETATHQAHYEAPFSVATISLSNNTLSTQITERNLKITITAEANASNNQIGWTDGSFLVKLPQEILTAEINNVEINNSQVNILSYELLEIEDTWFIKINTNNQNENPQSYQITIDVNLTPDPRRETLTRQVELYASNQEAGEYYYPEADIYDVNDNLNTEEIVNKTETSISLISPNSLLTNQTISEFDDKQSIVVSPETADIKPIYANVDNEKRQATIGVQLKNNYASTISDIKILGKIPFEGNTYAISGGNLNSTFTTNMTNEGILIPAGLEGKVTIYYSENTNPDTDLTKTENGWKTKDQVTNWESIRTYFIDFGDSIINTGDEYIFYYTVELPNGLAFNEVSYSHHGIYFSLDTDQGKYRTQTEPNKIGLRIAEKFDVETTKYQTGREKLVPGATYKITDVETGEIKTGVTNAQGIVNLTGLYAEKTYEIQEIKSPTNYALNGDIIRFIGHVDENGTLTIEKTQGTTKEDIQVTKQEGEDYKVTVKVEDEVKASLKIIKKEVGTQNLIRGVRFKITGSGLPENGRSLTTNSNGEVTLNGLEIGQEYTLEETKAVEGYYIIENPIKFKIENQEGNYVLNIIEGNVTTYTVEEIDSIPTINITLENEKIPTYNLNITKIKKETQLGTETGETVETEKLAGAKFKLYKEEKEIGEYTTDENGNITITGLYQYIEGKPENATYTLKEVLAPVGYAKVKDITFQVDGTTGELIFKNQEGTEENYTAQGTTVNLTIEDSPAFRLIKQDENGGRLSGVKFAIYNVEEGVIPARNSKGEILGTKETINGKEYYTLTTDQNGEITADLAEGLYKAVEVQAPEQYDISNQEHYFGIGASREAPTTFAPTWAQSIGGSDEDQITSVVGTNDGGYLVVGYFSSSSITVGNDVNENPVELTKVGNDDGMIIKYDVNGIVEWAQSIGGSYNEEITSVAETEDGYIVGGYFYGDITVGNDVNGNPVNLTNAGSSDGMIIKYDVDGKVEWAQSIGGSSSDRITSVSETGDGGYIVGGYFNSSSITVGNDVNGSPVELTNAGDDDGMIIKYDVNNNVEWAQSIGGSSGEYIRTVAETSDGGYIVGGYFGGYYEEAGYTLDLGNDVSLTGAGFYDGMIIKYGKEGVVEWAQIIGESRREYIYSVAGTSDGGYIVGGEFPGSITVGNDVNGSPVYLTSAGSYDGMIIKYDENNNVEWAQSIGGSNDDGINSVAGTSDGGYIVGGEFRSSSITVGNYTLENADSTTNYYDGMIIKYGANGVIEWARSIGRSATDRINSVAETSDGGYIIGGYFESSSITVGYDKNGTSIELTNANSAYSDGMIIKLEKIELNNPVTLQAQSTVGSGDDEITSVAETSDGGYIVGGEFDSLSITVGNDVNGSPVYLTRVSFSFDGMIIKYDENGNVEWAQSIGGGNNDYINSVAGTSDGGYIVGGYFNSSSITVGKDENGKPVELTKAGSSDGMIIKYDENGIVEWAQSIGGSDEDQITSVAGTSDGGYLVGGYFEGSSITVGNDANSNPIELTNVGSYDGMIIKYDENNNVEWAQSIGGSADEEIISVAGTRDGGYVVGGYFESSRIAVGNDVNANSVELTNASSGYSPYDGMLIKYDINGKVEWAKSIGGSGEDEIRTVAETSDGGYIVGGYFLSDSITVGNDVNGSPVELTNVDYSDGMIIKYDVNGNVEWAQSIGGTSYDYITSIKPTEDGYLVGGYFGSSSITVENYYLSNAGSNDGMIIKYDANGKVEFAKSIGGSSSDEITSVAEIGNDMFIAVGYFRSSTIETDGNILTNAGNEDGMILKIANQMGVPEVQELVVENTIKQFQITTDVVEIDGEKGGSISGENNTPYETVEYNQNSTKEIKITPDTGYEIISITVNGAEYPLPENTESEYTFPIFTNVKENIHIEVTFAQSTQKISILKRDGNTKTPLEGVTFKLDQIEERTEPGDVIGEVTPNGATYADADTENEVTEEVLGELATNSEYYFVQNTDGTLTPTNSKTYQLANGGTEGIGSTTANSYIPINLEGKEGNYVVVINASVSSESADRGYATINTSAATIPTYSSSTGRFVYISGTQEAKDHPSQALAGGSTYYLHLGYRKDGSIDTGDDQIVIHSIKVYQAKDVTYTFVNNNGVYESNNQGRDNTVANAYIPIDLSNLTGKYNVVVNASISSASGDYGYATITNGDVVTAPSASTSTNRFIYITGTQEAADYTTVLQGGQTYNLHLGYSKNTSGSSGDDKFTIHSVKITLNDSELYHTEVTTNSQGQAMAQIPYGRYQITEVKAPEGYEALNSPITIDFKDGNKAIVDNPNTANTVTVEGENYVIENNETAKLVVRHYLKVDGEPTTTEVAPQENYTGLNGENYTTSPKTDLAKYELEKDSSGNYVLPSNSIGNYAPGTTYVDYYYVEKEIPLTIHHYISGTETPVPLKDGQLAEDETYSGKEGTEYTTNPIADENLSDEYELESTPKNATGTYEGEEIVVTYYYTKVKRPLVIQKYAENGTTPIEGVKFEIQTKEEKEKIEQLEEIANVGKLQQNGSYYFIESDGKYISNNQNQNSTTANSYIKIDLSGKEDVTLKINAEVSSQSSDYGYVTINDSTTAPSYNTSTGRMFRISGQQAAQDYERVLTGGQVYYIHLGYYKNSYTSSYDDTFTVNSIKINEIEISEWYKEEYITDSTGKIELTLEAGEYIAEEISTPDIYALPQNPETEFSITKQTDTQTLEITNVKKQGTVITRHYIENTTTRVPSAQGGEVADETQTGNVGDIYATKESTNIAENYEYTGNTAGNVSGEYTEGTIEVIYYYRYKEPSIVTPTITKESTITKVTSPEQTMNYTINYQATIQDYIGNATVTIVDQLPYEIDESKANNIAETGGVYHQANKTITWTETIENINSFTSTNNVVNITKEINFVYQNVDTSDTVVENTVTGTINLTTPEKEETVTTTNEIPAEYLTDITVTKVWDDEEDVAQKRPDSVYIVIKEGVVEKGRALVNAENNWTCVFEDLPKYDIAGDEINYTITEEDVNTDDLKFYAEGVQAGSIDQGFTLTNQFAVPDETVNVTVNKVWNDTAKQQDKRPESITIVLNGGEKSESKTITTTGNTTVTFENLPKYNSQGGIINYTVEETGNNEFYPTGMVTGTMLSGYTITNTFTRPETTIDVTVTKAWEDTQEQRDKRPTEITAIITGTLETENDIVERYNVKESEGWTYTFEDLPKYDVNGDEIVYTVTEEENNDFYQLKEVTGDQTSGFTITNEFVRPEDTIDVTVTKAWEDTAEQQDRRPTEVTVSLAGTLETANDTVKTEIIKAEEGWTKTFTGLPKYDSNGDEIVYTVTEEKVNDFYQLKEVTGNQTNGFTITNEFIRPEDTIDVTVSKKWEDTAEQRDKRPTEVTVSLTGTLTTENDIVETEIIKAEENWIKTFIGLPKYDSNGDEIVYTVTEEENSYFYQLKEITGDVKTGFTITNEFVRPEDTIDVTVTKAWDDIPTQEDKRPGEITAVVTGTLETTNDTLERYNIKEVEGWTYTFTGLPKYNVNGDEIVYSVTEEGTYAFYELKEITGNQASGFVITNEFVQPTDTVDITVTKAWEDTTEQQGKRPTEVTAVVSGNGRTERYNVKASEGWTHTFEDLPKYDSNGNVITYTITEEGDYAFYELKEVTGDVETGFTITNEFVRPIDTIDVTVTKAWEDTTEQENKRPLEITAKITGTLETANDITKTYNIKARENWTYTFEDLPKYDVNGDIINYTVTEEGTYNFYQLKEITGDETTGFTITNEFVRPIDTIEITVTKAWEDTAEQQDRRPTEITAVVIGTLETTNDIVERYNIKEEEGWTYTFTGLPKYDSNGDIITYTVTEEGTYNFYQLKEVTGSQTSGFTITNEFKRPDDTIDVTVTKAWEDTQDQQDKRPTEITAIITGTLETENDIERKYDIKPSEGWTHTFEGLPKYDINGDEIVYTVTEEENSDFYQLKEITGDVKAGFTITNEFVRPQDTIDVTVTKAWEDTAEQQDKRPPEVTAVVSGNGKTERYNVKASEDWTHTFEDLPKYDSNGDEIVYTVAEEGTYEFYILKEVTGDQTSGFTITNQFVLPGDTVEVAVTKAWDDTTEQQNKRPDTIKAVITGGEITQKQDVKASENWTYTFTDLPKYDSNGEKITYTVTEEGTYEFYQLKEVTGSMETGFTITNEFVRPEDTIDVTVTKAWDDIPTQEDKRPGEITAVITGTLETANDTVERYNIKATENWTHTFEDLPKYDVNGNEIAYSVTEEGTYEFYQLKGVTGNAGNGFTITNEFVQPTDTVDVTVTKAWEDTEEQQGKRPTEITAVVSGNGRTERYNVKEAEGWTYTFEDLPKYDSNGNVITYTVTEEGDYEFYQLKEVTGDVETGFTITNEFVRPIDTVDVTVTKAWEDTAEQQGKRPLEITAKITGTLETANDITRTYNIKARENWTYTFEELPKYDVNGDIIDYTVTEEGTYNFYQLKEVTGDVETDFTITNEFVRPIDMVEVTVTKTWEDTVEQQDRRPTEITATLTGTMLTANDTVKTEVIKAEEGWTKIFTDLPKYDSNGDEIVYTVTEEGVNDFYQLKEITGDVNSGFTITNEFIRPDDTIEVTVTKAWEDTAEQQDKRPTEITATLTGTLETANDTVKTEVIKAEEGWTKIFTGLPKYDVNGNKIVYTVTEQEDSDFYQLKEVTGDVETGFTITNEFIRPIDTVEITVTKTWEDTAEQQDRRPPEITAVVTGTLETANDTVRRYNVKATENWTHTFEDLPKYDVNGDEIVYTVTEEENSDFYQLKEVTGDQASGFTITNEFVRPDDTIEVTVTKAWDDIPAQEDKRPAEITAVVTGTLETTNDTVERYNIKEEEGWTYTFTGLPKYNVNGDEIVYSITEEGSYEFYTLKEITGDMTNGFTITNQFVLPGDTIDVTVTKAWEDTADQQDKRPEFITTVITGGGTTQKYDIKESENWTHTFTRLPKYDNNGEEITYTVAEEGTYEFYALKEITGNQVSGFVITNEFVQPTDTVDIEVRKEWEDTAEQQDRRPPEITALVTGTLETANDTVRRYNVKATENWTHTFEDLPKYDVNGDEIVYSITEEGSYEFYTLKEITGDMTNGFTITNQFVLPGDTIDVTVTKAWEDTAEQQDKRPTEVTVSLTGTFTTENDTVKTEVIKAEEGWTKTFTDLPKYDSNGDEIVYTVTEERVNDFYQLKEITGDQASGFTVTNEFNLPDDNVDITVTKVWEDTEEQADKRPEEITAVITGSVNTPGDTVREGQIKKSENWTYTFEDLPKYDSDGNIINYSVTEIGEYQFYQLKDVIGDVNNGFTITNEFVRPEDTIEVTVHKEWVDKDDIYEKRPDFLILKVINTATQEETRSDPISITGEDSCTFTNLPKYDENGDEIVYTADEQEVSTNDLFNYGKKVGEITNIEGETNKKEITITNTIEKIPGTVEVRYVDINHQDEEDIATPVVKEGIVGEPFDVSEDKKEIPGYTFIRGPEDPTGIYTEEEQEKIYYYAKNTKVITKYLEQGTDIVLSEEPEYVQEGYVGKFYMTAPQEIEGYTYVADTNNLSGSMTEETITVIYYYAQNTKVTAKYLEQGTNKVLTEQPEYVQEGYIGKDYATEQKEIEGYTFVTVDGEVTGTMTKEPITITYYYAKNTQVITKYLEQGTNKVLTEQPEYVEEGYVGKDYATEQKKIEGYTFVTVEGETTGTMTEEPITVTYYYAKNTKVTVLHIDKYTNEILETETKEGKVGDYYTTESKNFEGYVLDESPEKPNGYMTEKEIILRYYYVHQSAGVIERHIDIITGTPIIEAIHHEGNENDYYNISSKTFENYDLVEEDEEGNSMLPENAEGNMKKDEVIEVVYYYHRKASVRVEYIDKLTGDKLTEDEIIQGHQNDPYETEAKEFEDYVLEKMPDNYKGSMEVTRNEDGSYNTETVVQYYYIPVAGGVKEEHIDISNNKIIIEETHSGKIGDEYDIPPRDIEGYKLVEEDEEGNSMLPTNAKGQMPEDQITVKYYYIKEAKVIVKYVDKQTGEELHQEEIKGYEGDPYETEAKEFDGYDLIEEPKNKTGEMEDKDITVTYYYAKKAEIEVQYLEKGTNNPLVENESMQGHVGDEYKTEAKEIPYYKFVESTNNTEGTMTEEKITIIYYYEKQVFNLKVDKWVDSVTMDGISQGGESLATKDELFKVEMHRSKVETADITIKYKIRISNVGEIEGNVNTITEVIPNGYTFYQEDNSIVWEDSKGILTTTELQDETIQPGEYKEIDIVLRWNKEADNFGEKDNLVILSNISNPAGYEDIYKEDNSSRAKMIVTISTGLDRNDKIVVVGTIQIVLAITVGLLVSYKKKKK